MSKEERYTYHCDQYDYVEVIYDNEECEEIDSMKMAEKRLNRQQDKISDLEAKLAEMQNEKDELIGKYRYWRGECAELKQQLAEKEKEIKQIKDKLHISEQEPRHFHNKYFAEKQIAIEQLEKVKETFTWGKDNGYLTPKNAVNIIDNQIKQLKEMK